MAVEPSTSTGDGDGDGSPSAAAAREIEYRFYCEFQSHDPEFDYIFSSTPDRPPPTATA